MRLKLGLLHYNRLIHQELAKNYIKKQAKPHYLDKAKSHNVDQKACHAFEQEFSNISLFLKASPVGFYESIFEKYDAESKISCPN